VETLATPEKSPPVASSPRPNELKVDTSGPGATLIKRETSKRKMEPNSEVKVRPAKLAVTATPGS